MSLRDYLLENNENQPSFPVPTYDYKQMLLDEVRSQQMQQLEPNGLEGSLLDPLGLIGGGTLMKAAASTKRVAPELLSEGYKFHQVDKFYHGTGNPNLKQLTREGTTVSNKNFEGGYTTRSKEYAQDYADVSGLRSNENFPTVLEFKNQNSRLAAADTKLSPSIADDLDIYPPVRNDGGADYVTVGDLSKHQKINAADQTELTNRMQELGFDGIDLGSETLFFDPIRNLKFIK